MKRLVAVLVVVALVMTGAFAQISFSGWGRGAFVPAQATGDADPTTETSASWGYGAPRIGFTVTGSSDNMGFQVKVKADDGTLVVDDVAKIWWQANDVLKVSIGRVQGDALRGKIGDVPLRRWVGPCANEDNIFTRFWTTGAVDKVGALVEVTPVDGLYIGASTVTGSHDKGVKTEFAYKDNLQVAVGYNFEGIGHFRAQYVGSNIGADGSTGKTEYLEANGYAPSYTNMDNGGRIEFAFAPAFLDGVSLDIGAKIPLDADKMGYKAVVAAGANFAIGEVGVWSRADATIYENASDVAAYVIPSFGLDFATIGCDISVSVASAKNVDTEVGFGVAPWIQKGYSNGYIKAAVAIKQDVTSDKLDWALPVIFEYWF